MDFSGDELTARFKLMPGMPWVWPPPRMPVASEGLVRDFLLKMVHNPGGDCYWEGSISKLCLSKIGLGYIPAKFDAGMLFKG